MGKTARLSAGVVVVRQQAGQWLYLLLRAYQYWDFPKGIVEHEEDPLAAAIRETEEETTIDDLTFRWGEVYTQTPPYNNGRKVARYYLAETHYEAIHLPVTEELGKPEHDEYRWVSYAEAKRLTGPRVGAVVDWADGIINGKVS